MSAYTIDAGFFPTPIEVCFSNKDFFKALKKYGLPEDLNPEMKPLDKGVAETHAFGRYGEAFVVVLFNVESFAHDVSSMAGIVAHETVHVVERIFDHVGEDDVVGEETRAYLVQHLVEQIFQACVMEIHAYAKRKSNRKTSGQVGEGKAGDVPEVGEPQHDGSTGSNSAMRWSDKTRGIKRPTGKAISTTDVFYWSAGKDRNTSLRSNKRGRG
jgi:hypothetical protein